MDKHIQNIVLQWNNVISECRDWSNMIIAIALFVIGTTTAIVSILSNTLTGNIAVCCFALGAVLMCIGFGIAITKGSELRYKPTNSKIKVGQRFVKRRDWNRVAAEFVDAQSVILDGDGELRIDTLKSDDGKFNVYMVSQFVDFDYKVIYGPIEK